MRELEVIIKKHGKTLAKVVRKSLTSLIAAGALYASDTLAQSSLAFSWTFPTNQSANTKGFQLLVQRLGGSSAAYPIPFNYLTNGVCEKTITNIQPNSAYVFNVRALDDRNVPSPWSRSISYASGSINQGSTNAPQISVNYPSVSAQSGPSIQSLNTPVIYGYGSALVSGNIIAPNYVKSLSVQGDGSVQNMNYNPLGGPWNANLSLSSIKTNYFTIIATDFNNNTATLSVPVVNVAQSTKSTVQGNEMSYSGNLFSLKFNAEQNKWYGLERSRDLSSPTNWTLIDQQYPATGTLTDTNPPADHAFYRILSYP